MKRKMKRKTERKTVYAATATDVTAKWPVETHVIGTYRHHGYAVDALRYMLGSPRLRPDVWSPEDMSVNWMEGSEMEMKPKFNHERFGGDLVKALHTWSWEDQNFDIKSALEADGEDPNDLETIYGYWAYDQLTEFIEWMFRETKEGKR